MERGAINAIWQKWFPKEYLKETELYKPVTSHYGRHWFSTYWEHQGISREQRKYLRGDKTSKDSVDDNDAVNDYIHTAHLVGSVEILRMWQVSRTAYRGYSAGGRRLIHVFI